MSFEVIQKVGKYQYIYLADGYRNESGGTAATPNPDRQN
jgi:hypothetical protein